MQKESTSPPKKCCVNSALIITTSCQFGYGETLHKYDGKSYCMFHLPAEEKKNWGEDQIKEFDLRISEIIEEPNLKDYKGYKIHDFSRVIWP